ncbi:hypothetical protein F0562_020101 [Nyssa sinensis]|uniref:Anaphase-promoting complex subunit 11 RING-H2 finger domain-containing protein n=1 Tax=Nyssa sinensis TaxID=561372 RepID=A0A5J5BU82_9ASTE|nr:hypothetical protein F0562_020101 [Nyssa sinensis]
MKLDRQKNERARGRGVGATAEQSRAEREERNMKVKLLRSITFAPLCTFRWHAVASWTWDAQDETCGICRMAFDGCCPDCKLPGDDCPLMWGNGSLKDEFNLTRLWM